MLVMEYVTLTSLVLVNQKSWTLRLLAMLVVQADGSSVLTVLTFRMVDATLVVSYSFTATLSQ